MNEIEEYCWPSEWTCNGNCFWHDLELTECQSLRFGNGNFEICLWIVPFDHPLWERDNMSSNRKREVMSCVSIAWMAPMIKAYFPFFPSDRSNWLKFHSLRDYRTILVATMPFLRLFAGCGLQTSQSGLKLICCFFRLKFKDKIQE